MSYGHFVHRQARCHAAQNGVENQALIVGSLLSDAAAGTLDSFRMETILGSDQINVTFKKKSDSTSSLIEPGDYLVEYEDGTKVAMTAEAFEGNYMPVEGFYTDCSETNRDKLAR